MSVDSEVQRLSSEYPNLSFGIKTSSTISEIQRFIYTTFPIKGNAAVSKRLQQNGFRITHKEKAFGSGSYAGYSMEQTLEKLVSTEEATHD